MKVILTGGAGFIGSCFLAKLNNMGVTDILVVDELGTNKKWKNLVGKQFDDYIEKDGFIDRIRRDALSFDPDCIVHLGACSSTTESDASYLVDNNYRYSRELALWALRRSVRFVYASSAATYGAGDKGYSDDDADTPQYKPLNMYGYSKHLFDLWVLKNDFQKHFVGFKYFNVFGPNEYHKGSMQSKVFKGFHEINETGKIKLFKSYHPDYKDGEQKRDFVYVKDIVDSMWYFLEHSDKAGIYNLGMGIAHTWNQLAQALFTAMNKPVAIDYIDMPAILKDKYQYFTQANITKLRDAGYTSPFTSLQDAISDYVSILQTSYYL